MIFIQSQTYMCCGYLLVGLSAALYVTMRHYRSAKQHFQLSTSPTPECSVTKVGQNGYLHHYQWNSVWQRPIWQCMNAAILLEQKQACKPWSYTSLKLCPLSDLLTHKRKVEKGRATSVTKKLKSKTNQGKNDHVEGSAAVYICSLAENLIFPW